MQFEFGQIPRARGWVYVGMARLLTAANKAAKAVYDAAKRSTTTELPDCGCSLGRRGEDNVVCILPQQQQAGTTLSQAERMYAAGYSRKLAVYGTT